MQARRRRWLAGLQVPGLVSILYGLGNRILATASAVLVGPSNEMGKLFCEPFPDTTPAGLPAGELHFSISTAKSYGNMLRNKVLHATKNGLHQPTNVSLLMN
ncbi:hypothetical protein C2845_PM12G25650 [Panicum miliaceum]|uniref:Fucosyltransferase n=1 Tax=Panicum miliaceum TaxID=4540 RepID=A0A3L6QEX3_PANMI|nr:hypothetical protein C2845_PM12G25650 [Panicum miliaceum]